MNEPHLNRRQKRKVQFIQKQINKKHIKQDQIHSKKISTIPFPIRAFLFILGLSLSIASFIFTDHFVLLIIVGILMVFISIFGFRKTIENILDSIDHINFLDFLDFS
jgi:hypothetical protein